MTGDDAGPGTARSHFETSLPGVYAVGDVRHGATKRVASSVGEGSVVIGSVQQTVHASHARFAGSPIRDFVPVLVERTAKTSLTTRLAQR